MIDDEPSREGNRTLGGERKAVYVHREDGRFELAPSAGLEMEEIVTRQAVAEFRRLADEARDEVARGRASPLKWHMYDRRMDVPTLAQSTGHARWRVRRHLKPGPFRRLKAALRQRYADALGITPDELERVPHE